MIERSLSEAARVFSAASHAITTGTPNPEAAKGMAALVRKKVEPTQTTPKTTSK